MKYLVLLVTMLTFSVAFGQQRTVLFSHQSVGRHIVSNPSNGTTAADATLDIRTLLDSEVEFWDHDYYGQYNGITDNTGSAYANGYTHRGTTSPNNDAGDVGLTHLIGSAFKAVPTADAYSTAAEALAWRDYCSTFDILIIKPGYRDIHLLDEAELQEYKDFLTVASDWWHANNPGQYFVVMTSSSLRQYSDYSGSTAGFVSDASGIEQTTRYAEFERWLATTWACQNPENRAFGAFQKCTNQAGTVDEINFTVDAYKYTDHHLNAAGSDMVQTALVSFINGLVAEMNEPTGRPQFRISYDP